MKVFFDTNVIIEYLIKRDHFDATKQVIDKLINGSHVLCMSAGGFYTILYIIDKYLNKELRIEKATRVAFLRNMARGILKDYHIEGHDNESLLQGINDLRFSDLEDSCQLQAAKSSNCQYLLTFNVKDFPAADPQIKILTPERFLDEWFQ